MTLARIQHLVLKQPSLLSALLLRRWGLSTERVDELLWLGAIYVNKSRVSQDQILQPQDYLRVHLQPKPYREITDWAERVIYQCDEFLVVDKPTGVPVHPMLDNQRQNVLFGLQEQLGIPAHVTHRLDIQTQGVLVVAKCKDFQRWFQKEVGRQTFAKSYTCWTQEQLPLGLWRHYMEPTKTFPKQLSPIESEIFCQKCELKVLRSEQGTMGTHFSQIQLLTGRTHQIRAQLAHRGHPIINDITYGGPQSSPHPFGLQHYQLEMTWQNQPRQFTAKKSLARQISEIGQIMGS